MDRPKPFRAPDYIVDEWARLLAGWSPGGAFGPLPGSPEHVEAVRAQARLTADRGWAEAFAAGQAHAMETAAANPITIDVSGFDRERLGSVLNSAELLDPIRYNTSAWREPEPYRMSVIRPEEYQPDRCPLCAEPVTESAPQYPQDPLGRCPSDRVLLKPCQHVIRFHDDTIEEFPLGY